MLFLIEYDRGRGKTISLRTFYNSERPKAHDAAFELELSLHGRKIEREVVILEATSEKAIRLTHSRYFESLDELTNNLRARLLM
jgi:hypothetical protein